jgi:hypothetical protein
MKKVLISPIISMLLLCSSASFAVTDEASEGSSGYYQQHNEDVDQLAKLLEMPEVQEIKTKCEKENDPDLSTCIWNKVQENEATKEKVIAKMNETLEDSKNGISQYESVTALATKNNKSKSLKALEKFYAEKISKELFGDPAAQSDKIKLLDHKKFNKIYENQLTKNILTAVSSFCIEANMINGFPLISRNESGRNSQRKTNIKSLSAGTVTKDDGNGNQVEISSAEKESSNWQLCMDNAQYVCHGGEKIIKDSDGNKTKVTAKSKLGVDCSSSDSDEKDKCKDFNYTKGRACELTNYLKIAKQNLKAVEKIAEGYKEIGKIKSYGVEGTDSKMKKVTENVVIDKEKLENITSTSSNEFANESGFSDEVKADLADLERCVTKNPDTGAMEFVAGAEESCKKYLNTDHESRDQMMQEHMLRQKALAAKVEKLNDTGDSEEDLKKFLRDQGRSDEEIEKQLKNVDIKKLKEQITQRYENEKDALIESMNARLEKTSSEKDGMIDITPGSKDLVKLTKIHEELSAKTESYTQLIHYNNIVTGFLEIQDKDGNSKGRNTASIKKELENSAYTEDSMQKLGIDKTAYENQLEGIGNAIEASNISLGGSQSASNSEEETSSTIGVDRINEDILNYDIEPEPAQ